MPNPRKPAKLKAISGTNQKCRETVSIDYEQVPEVPDAPDWLPNAHAVKEWDRLAPILHNVGILTEAGVMALGHLCALHGKLVQLWSAGETPTGHMLGQYRALINDFGLTPVAQSKVKPMDGKSKKANKFAQLKGA